MSWVFSTDSQWSCSMVSISFYLSWYETTLNHFHASDTFSHLHPLLYYVALFFSQRCRTGESIPSPHHHCFLQERDQETFLYNSTDVSFKLHHLAMHDPECMVLCHKSQELLLQFICLSHCSSPWMFRGWQPTYVYLSPS